MCIRDRAALGRALATFSHATDDASINGYADANFLRARIKAHIDGIRVAVLAVVDVYKRQSTSRPLG